jgi:dephospho-CoA kinase
MKVVGLTGGVGMGKSAAARLLQQHGVALVDTDELARRIVEPGQPALEEVKNAFGSEVLDHQGKLQRDVVARLVFSDSHARKQLEAILHPKIQELWQAEVERWRQAGLDLGVVVIPLLYETNAQELLDNVICVACSAITQRERLRERGWSAREIDQRIAAQWPTEKKIAAADFVIWTEGGMDVHQEQLQSVLSNLHDSGLYHPNRDLR